MSTYLYLYCLSHTPNVRSEREVTQHARADDELEMVRAWVGWAPTISAHVENDHDDAVRLAVQHAPHRLPREARSQYALAAVEFLSQHPYCAISARTEYGEWVDVGHGTPDDGPAEVDSAVRYVDAATGEPCVRTGLAADLDKCIVPEGTTHHHRAMTADDVVRYLVETRTFLEDDRKDSVGGRCDGLSTAVQQISWLLNRLGYNDPPTPREAAEDRIREILREQGADVRTEVIEMLAADLRLKGEDD